MKKSDRGGSSDLSGKLKVFDGEGYLAWRQMVEMHMIQQGLQYLLDLKPLPYHKNLPTPPTPPSPPPTGSFGSTNLSSTLDTSFTTSFGYRSWEREMESWKSLEREENQKVKERDLLMTEWVEDNKRMVVGLFFVISVGYFSLGKWSGF